MQLAGLQSNKAGINFDRNVAEVDLGRLGKVIRRMAWLNRYSH